MRELRTQENKEFENFFSIVREEASKNGGVFFVDSGEGREIFRPGIEGEDLFGWLIPNDRANEFEVEFSTNAVDEDKWEEFECIARWDEIDGKITISFEMMSAA